MSDQQLDVLDRPIRGAAAIAAAAGMYKESKHRSKRENRTRSKKDPEPDADAIYYMHEQGHLAGIVYQRGSQLVSTLRLLQQIGTTSSK